MAEFKITKSVEINRPAEAVFQYVNDIPRTPEWRPSVTIRDFSGEPLAVGSSFSELSKFMGREMVIKTEVTALEEGLRCEMKMDGGVVSGNMTWDFSPVTDDSSTATLNFDGDVSGWMAGLAKGLIRNQADKDMTKDLANLKSILEAS